MQSQIAVCLSLADGTSLVTEKIFENRFKYTDELTKMGANIKVEAIQLSLQVLISIQVQLLLHRIFGQVQHLLLPDWQQKAVHVLSKSSISREVMRTSKRRSEAWAVLLNAWT